MNQRIIKFSSPLSAIKRWGGVISIALVLSGTPYREAEALPPSCRKAVEAMKKEATKLAKLPWVAYSILPFLSIGTIKTLNPSDDLSELGLEERIVIEANIKSEPHPEIKTKHNEKRDLSSRLRLARDDIVVTPSERSSPVILSERSESRDLASRE